MNTRTYLAALVSVLAISTFTGSVHAEERPSKSARSETKVSRAGKSLPAFVRESPSTEEAKPPSKAAPVAPPDDPSSTACKSDVECPGDEFCSDGECVSPPKKVVRKKHVREEEPESDDRPYDREASPKKADKLQLPIGLVFIPRVGIGIGGTGTIDRKESAGSSGSAEYQEKSPLHVGVEILGSSRPNFRLGGAVIYNSSFGGEISGTKLKFGSDLSFVGVIEPVVPVSSTVAFAFRAQAGLMLYIPGGDMKDVIDQWQLECRNSTGVHCDYEQGPFAGWIVGGGAGIVTQMEGVRPRLDFMFDYYSVGGPSRTASASGRSLTTEFAFASPRTMVMFGVEL